MRATSRIWCDDDSQAEAGINDCWILTFDSMSGNRAKTVELLKTYLAMEAQTKLGKTTLELLTTEIRERKVVVPGQTNFSDCGLYLLHYAERFLADPDCMLSALLSAGQVSARDADELWDSIAARQRRARTALAIRGLCEEYAATAAKKQRPECAEKIHIEGSAEDTERPPEEAGDRPHTEARGKEAEQGRQSL